MKKLKHLLPSLREKKRYVVFEIISNANIKDIKQITKSIVDTSISFLGELQSAKAGIKILRDRFNANKQKGVIKVNHKYVDELKASLMLVKEIEGNDVIIRTSGVSGILKKAVSNFI